MNQNILHVGLDVDDTQYHGSAFNRETGEVIDFRCRPTLKGLLTQLDKLQRHFRGRSTRLCYEASYVGYCLQRDLIVRPLNLVLVVTAGHYNQSEGVFWGHRMLSEYVLPAAGVTRARWIGAGP